MSNLAASPRVSKHARPGTFRQLHIRLNRADEEAIARGLQGLQLLGHGALRNRADYVRHVLHEALKRTQDALRAHSGSR